MSVHEKSPPSFETRTEETSVPWFAQEQQDDKTTIRWAWVVAIVLHAALLLVQLPDLAATEPPPPEKPKVYVVEQVRFKEPPPPRERELPEPSEQIVPIPDPTPDDPEPIREVREVQPDIELPPDVVIEIPAGPPEQAPVGPIPVGGDVTAPVKIYAPQPGYTEAARRAGVEGFVIVEAIVDRNGDVVDAKIQKGLPLGLDQASLQAIRQWKFEPATLNGKPVDVYYNVTVTFRLQ